MGNKREIATMTDHAHSDATGEARAGRHALLTRLWHWINAIALIVLFMSGLNIFNAHNRLYWGQYGANLDPAWLSLPDFPGWITIPSYYSLADARIWHFFFAWVLAVSLALFMIGSLVNRHVGRDLAVSRREWRWSAIRDDLAAHLAFEFDHGDGKYNLLQRIAYIVVIFVLIPLMILTGLTMSPAMAANWEWLLTIFGGRQSARSIHFIIAWSLAGFFILHIALVLATGPIGHIRGMITGRRPEPEAQP